MMNPIIVNELGYLNKVRSLLHQCYLEHLEWEICQSNPSRIQIQQQDGKLIISDDYDDLAVWFSVVNDNDDCIACGRICHNDVDGLLEVERYSNAKRSLKEVLHKKNQLNIVELNREAVLPEYANNNKPYLLLLKSIFQYCLNKNYTILTTSNLTQWVNIYDKIGFNRLNAPFRYFDSEPEPVISYFANKCDIKNMLSKINRFLNEDDL
jgi:hypothetical protein